MILTEERIIQLCDEELPPQGIAFDCLAFARLIEREIMRIEKLPTRSTYKELYEQAREPLHKWHSQAVEMGYDGVQDALDSLNAVKLGPRLNDQDRLKKLVEICRL